MIQLLEHAKCLFRSVQFIYHQLSHKNVPHELVFLNWFDLVIYVCIKNTSLSKLVTLKFAISVLANLNILDTTLIWTYNNIMFKPYIHTPWTL